MTTQHQPSLLSWQPRTSARRNRSSIEERYLQFHAEHPEVFARMLAMARAQLAAGARRIAAKALFEQLRATLSLEHGGKFMLDNSLCSRFADACIEADPRLGAVIERRRRRVA